MERVPRATPFATLLSEIGWVDVEGAEILYVLRYLGSCVSFNYSTRVLTL